MRPSDDATTDAVTTAADGGVPLVRVEEPERRFDRERVLGRDAASVFPTLAQAEADKVAGAAQAVIGSMNFVTETELEEIKERRGGTLRVEDGTAEASKPLWAVLQEAKEAKEEAFAQGWKTIKQGQNKPLDEEEIEFLDEVEDAAREDERRRIERERDDVETFRLARETMVVKAAPERRNDRADDARLRTEPKRARRDAGAASVAARVKPVNRIARAKIVARDASTQSVMRAVRDAWTLHSLSPLTCSLVVPAPAPPRRSPSGRPECPPGRRATGSPTSPCRTLSARRRRTPCSWSPWGG